MTHTSNLIVFLRMESNLIIQTLKYENQYLRDMTNGEGRGGREESIYYSIVPTMIRVVKCVCLNLSKAELVTEALCSNSIGCDY